MNESARMKFASLTLAGKQRFLALVGLDLTIAGRGFILDRRGEDTIAALAGLNELQHKLLGQIAALATDAERYPDDVLWSILHELATHHSIDGALAHAIVFADSHSN